MTLKESGGHCPNMKIKNKRNNLKQKIMLNEMDGGSILFYKYMLWEYIYQEKEVKNGILWKNKRNLCKWNKKIN